MSEHDAEIIGYVICYADGTANSLPWRNFGRFLAQLTHQITLGEAHPDWEQVIGYRVICGHDIPPRSFLALARLFGPPPEEPTPCPLPHD